MWIIDKYFIRPLFWDYFLALSLVMGAYSLFRQGYLHLSKELDSVEMATDLSGVSLTSTGFILTLLTVLISFKSSSRLSKANYNESNTSFEIFFASNLYFETVKHLKNCIKSLIIISVLGYTLKLSLSDVSIKYLYFYNVGGLTIVVLTLWRCLVILSKVLKMQKEE